VVASTVERLESILSAEASQNSVVHDANPIAEDVSLFHGVGRKNNGSLAVFVTLLQNVPKLPSSLRVEASRWFIQKDHFGIGNQ